MGGALYDPDPLTREDGKGQAYTGEERSSRGQLCDLRQGLVSLSLSYLLVKLQM